MNQGRIQEFAKGGPVPPVPFISHSSLPFSSPPYPSPWKNGPSNQLEGLGNAVSSPIGVRVEPRPKTLLVHFKAVRKPLVAIILNILSTMFYSRTIKI